MKNRYIPYSLPKSTLSNKYKFNISSFLGVDYTPAQLNIDTRRAVDIKNFIYKDKVNQKRTGFEQLLEVKPVEYSVLNANGTLTEKTNSTNINGVWSFVALDGNRHVIAHIGNLLFEITGIGKDYTAFDFKAVPILGDNNTTIYELDDYKSTAFVGNKKLYILGGNKYFVLSYEDEEYKLLPVEEDENTYIPVTSIGITYADSAISESAILDDVNLLSRWRKNKLVSGTYYDDGTTARTTRFWDWQLDTSVLPKEKADLNKIVVKINTLKEI